MPENIIHLRDSRGIYGTERVLLTLGKNIDRERFRLILVCMRHRDGRSEDLIQAAQNLDIEVNTIDVNGMIDINSIRRLRRLIRTSGAKIIQSHDYKSDIYALLATLGTGTRRVATAHGSTRDSLKKRFYLSLTENIVYRFATRIVAVSKDISRHLYHKGIPEDRIAIITNGIDVSILDGNASKRIDTDIADFKGNNRIFSVVGRLFPDKGHRYFLRAFAHIRKQHPDVAALIVGDGPERHNILKMIKDLDIETSVRLTGFYPDMENIYRNTDFLVIPSLREGLPYTLLEGMSESIPVLATAVGDIPILIQNGVTGILIPPGSESDLRRGMQELLNNPVKSGRLADNALTMVTRKFSKEQMVRSTEEMYNYLLN